MKVKLTNDETNIKKVKIIYACHPVPGNVTYYLTFTDCWVTDISQAYNFANASDDKISYSKIHGKGLSKHYIHGFVTIK